MNDHTIVALLATQGSLDFLTNALISLTRVGVDTRIVHVARPDDAGEVDLVLKRFGAVAHPFGEFNATLAQAPTEYLDYGTDTFIAINWAKVRYLRWLIEQYSHVVYADLDVVWLADPLWYLQAAARWFPLAFQTEAVPRFPPIFCWGLISASASEASRELFDTLLEVNERRNPANPVIDEQASCCALIERDPSWLAHIYPLPEGLFLNGLGYRSLLGDSRAQSKLQGSLAPFTFHANWIKGADNKRAVMRETGTWLLDKAPVSSES